LRVPPQTGHCRIVTFFIVDTPFRGNGGSSIAAKRRRDQHVPHAQEIHIDLRQVADAGGDDVAGPQTRLRRAHRLQAAKLQRRDRRLIFEAIKRFGSKY
jgi:hypothetical protein